MATKSTKHFTIDRGRGKFERTIVGRTGRTHMDETDNQGKNGHFTDEGEYRRAIARAVRENGG